MPGLGLFMIGITLVGGAIGYVWYAFHEEKKPGNGAYEVSEHYWGADSLGIFMIPIFLVGLVCMCLGASDLLHTLYAIRA